MKRMQQAPKPEPPNRFLQLLNAWHLLEKVVGLWECFVHHQATSHKLQHLELWWSTWMSTQMTDGQLRFHLIEGQDSMMLHIWTWIKSPMMWIVGEMLDYPIISSIFHDLQYCVYIVPSTSFYQMDPNGTNLEPGRTPISSRPQAGTAIGSGNACSNEPVCWNNLE